MTLAPGLVVQPVSGLLGGRVQRAAAAWRRYTRDPFILDVVSNGWRFEFASSPTYLPPRPIHLEPEADAALHEQLSRLLSIGAVRRLSSSEVDDVVVWNPIFVVPKHTGSYRLILDARHLNSFLVHLPLRMEHLRKVRRILKPHDFLISCDLKDAYLTCGLNPDMLRFTAFMYDGIAYAFTSMVFGVSQSPAVFSRLAAVPMRMIRQLGCRASFYLDDDVLAHSSASELIRYRNIYIQLLYELGFELNIEKSVLAPSHSLVHLGFRMDTIRFVFSVPHQKISGIKHLIRTLIDKIDSASPVSLRDYSRVVATILALRDGCENLAFYARPLLMDLAAFERQVARDNYDRAVVVSNEAIECLRLWTGVDAGLLRNPIAEHSPSIEIVVDASLDAAGAAQLSGPGAGRSLAIPFDHELSSINEGELLGALFALRTFVRDDWTGATLLFRVDSQVALSYIRKAGGRVPLLSDIASQIYRILVEHRIHVRVAWLSSEDNFIADSLSRVRLNDYSGWTLTARFRSLVINHPCNPTIDLFATHLNAVLPRFCAATAVPGALAVDAFSISWTGEVIFANPPPSLLLHVLRKAISDRTSGIIIVPWWRGSIWFPLLQQLWIAAPIPLSGEWFRPAPVNGAMPPPAQYRLAWIDARQSSRLPHQHPRSD